MVVLADGLGRFWARFGSRGGRPGGRLACRNTGLDLVGLDYLGLF